MSSTMPIDVSGRGAAATLDGLTAIDVLASDRGRSSSAPERLQVVGRVLRPTAVLVARTLRLRPLWSFALGLNGLALLATQAAGLAPLDLQVSLGLPSLCLAVALVIHRCWPGRRRLTAVLELFAFISCVKIPLVLLSYTGAALAFPLWDDTLLRLDRWMGFDWVADMHWVDRHALLASALQAAYRTIWLQLLVLVAIGTAAGRRDAIRSLMASVVVALAVTIPLGALCPALGMLSHFPGETFEVLRFTGGSTPIPVVQALRSGNLTTIALWQPQGMIVFPSFHAAMAVILAAASLRHRAASIVFVPLNALMFLSAYTEGGHYVCDLIAGAAIGLLARHAAVRLTVNRSSASA